MIAILSDVHANLEAMQAVFEDLKKRSCKRVFFLGDFVGYGPNPVEVLDYIKDFEFCLLGNHDEACLNGPLKTFNEMAQRSTWWTRSQICPEEMVGSFFRPGALQKRQEQWNFLKSLKPVRMLGEMMFVHDYPAEPGCWEYVRKPSDAEKGFKVHPTVKAFFFGHSHVPGVWFEDGCVAPEAGQRFDFKKRVMVNVGSVGQPRDKDPRACYVILEADSFRFFRVPYDYTITQEKILANEDLDPFLAERLAKGT